MNFQNKKIALVTGANSGVGLETVKQLSAQSYGKVILVCRTVQKAEHTLAHLLETGFDSEYAILEADLSSIISSQKALKTLIKRDEKIDSLILNACATPAQLEKNAIGMELTFASALLGHHIIAKGLLDGGLLSHDCRIVTSGSEAASGNVPGMSLPNLENLISNEHHRDPFKTFKSFMFPNGTKTHAPMKVYAMTKLGVSLWTEAFAKRIPEGMIANSISPGATPQTNLARHQPWWMRGMMFFMKIIGPLLGISGSLKQAANRYLKILEFTKETNGKFWASKKGKMSGPLVLQSNAYIDNIIYQESIWDILEEVSTENIIKQ